MGNIYSAQNVTAYVIYEFNDAKEFLNACGIQQILADVNLMWHKVFGHSAFSEQTHDLKSTGYTVKEIADEYKEHGSAHLIEPAKEWFLKYGEFQLVRRPYAVPNFTAKEEIILKRVLAAFRLQNYAFVNVAV